MLALTLLSLAAGLGKSENFPILFWPNSENFTVRYQIYFTGDNTNALVGVDPKLSYQENFQTDSDSCENNCTMYMTDHHGNKWEGILLGVNNQESSYQLFNDNDDKYTSMVFDFDKSYCANWPPSQSWLFYNYVLDSNGRRSMVYPYVTHLPSQWGSSDDPPLMLTSNNSITNGRIYGGLYAYYLC